MDRITNPPPRRGPSRLAFHASRIIVDAGVLIAMTAMSLPFVVAAGADRDSVTADALPVILLLAPVFVITLIPDHSRPIPAPLAWVSLVFALGAFPFAIVKYLDAAALAETLGGSVGFGARLLIFGTFVALAGIGVTLAGHTMTSSPWRPTPDPAAAEAASPAPAPGAPGSTPPRTPAGAARTPSHRRTGRRSASQPPPEPRQTGSRQPPHPETAPRPRPQPTRQPPPRRQPGAQPGPAPHGGPAAPRPDPGRQADTPEPGSEG